ncbi:MAG: hypothetical protein ABL970_06640 [Nitrospira sp.]
MAGQRQALPVLIDVASPIPQPSYAPHHPLAGPDQLEEARLGLVLAVAWLIGYTNILDYSPGGGPMRWRSPIRMPLAWEIVAVQFGETHHPRSWFTALLAGAAGGIGIFLCDAFAYRLTDGVIPH